MPLLPAPVERLIAAINRGDTEAFLDAFPENGVVNDRGRPYVGRAAIRAWSDAEFIGAEARVTPQTASACSGEVDVRAGWTGVRHAGDSRFVFVLDGHTVRELRITSV